MFRLFSLIAALVVLFSSSAFAASSVNARGSPAATPIVVAASQIQFFDTEAAAQKHCPSDTVVWLNIPSGIYHMKGERWYGRTKNGAYVCQKEADAAGYRETRNGQ
jgi:hypothetical protein